MYNFKNLAEIEDRDELSLLYDCWNTQLNLLVHNIYNKIHKNSAYDCKYCFCKGRRLGC